MEKEVPNIIFDPDKLLAILKETNVSQSHLARSIGAGHRNVISKIVRNKRTVTVSELFLISKFFNKNPLYFAKNN